MYNNSVYKLAMGARILNQTLLWYRVYGWTSVGYLCAIRLAKTIDNK